MHSMSKGFNMIGWRLGFVCGHAKIVQAYADVKDNSDSGPVHGGPARRGAGAPDAGDPVSRCGRNTSAGLEKLVAALKQGRLQV